MSSRIILIHGWTYSIERWLPVVDALNSKGLNIELLKVPGLSGEELSHAWMIDNYVNWLKEIVGNDEVILIGHSNGGRIALNFAIKYPQLVERTILIDSAGIPRTELSQKLKRTVFKAAAKTGKVFTKSETAKKVMYRLSGVSDYKQASPVMQQTMKNLLQSDYNLDASKISTPTSLIWGENDTATPFKDAKLLNSQIKNSSLKVIKGSGHAPHISHTQEVIDRLEEILR